MHACTKTAARAITCTLFLLAAGRAASQVPDTLDPRGYFPLEVGNTWEYRHDLDRPASPMRSRDESTTHREHYRILSSRTVGDTTFYDMLYDMRAADGSVIQRDTSRIWYDPAIASIRGNPPQLIAMLECVDAPFGPPENDDAQCPPFVRQELQHLPDLFGSQEMAVKSLSSSIWSVDVVHGIGIVGAGGGCEPCGSFDD